MPSSPFVKAYAVPMLVAWWSWVRQSDMSLVLLYVCVWVPHTTWCFKSSMRKHVHFNPLNGINVSTRCVNTLSQHSTQCQLLPWCHWLSHTQLSLHATRSFHSMCVCVWKKQICFKYRVNCFTRHAHIRRDRLTSIPRIQCSQDHF